MGKILKILFCIFWIVLFVFWAVMFYQEVQVALSSKFFLFPPLFAFAPIVVPACVISALTLKEEYDEFDKVKFMDLYYKKIYRLYKKVS
jgi:hypothetical protein